MFAFVRAITYAALFIGSYWCICPVGSCRGRASNDGHCALSAMLTVSQLSKSFAGRALFDDVSFQVNRGDRIGLVSITDFWGRILVSLQQRV